MLTPLHAPSFYWPPFGGAGGAGLDDLLDPHDRVDPGVVREDDLARLEGLEAPHQAFSRPVQDLHHDTGGASRVLALPARRARAFFASQDRVAIHRAVHPDAGHEEIVAVEGLPLAVARYLESQSLSSSLVGWLEYAALDWNGAGLDYASRPANGGDASGLTGCFCAIAETGTLLLLGSPNTPKVTALLPETHIAVVRKDRIVRTMEDAFALMRKEVGEPPRATFFVSGPSRTADIEQTIVIGAHGPYRVHVILV